MAVTPQSPAAQVGSRTGFSNRAQYIAFLESERKRRGKTGEAWFQAQMAKVRARDEAYSKAREDAEQLWRSQVDAWSAAGGFDQIVAALPLGEPYERAGRRMKFHVGAAVFEIDPRRQACSRWDGALFANGKKGRSGAFGVALSYFELEGVESPSRRARELVIAVSGIAPSNQEITDDMRKQLDALRAKQEADAQRRKEAEEREDPLSDEERQLVPERITDPAAIDELTGIMAKERNFPLEYARKLVAEGFFWFGTWRYRDEDSGRVIDSGRPVVMSDVKGINTGRVITYSGRELKEFCPPNSGKGKNYPNISKGVVVMGNWSETTKRVTLVEGAYDAAAIRLMRERRNKPLQDDEAILIFAGARLPDRLLESCCARGVAVTGAFDADIAGYALATQLTDYAEQKQLKHRVQLPLRGEFTLHFKNTPWGRDEYKNLMEQLRSRNINFLHGVETPTHLELVGSTNAASCELLADLRKRSHERTEGIDPADKEISIQWHRKDWNELIQREYRPRAQTPAGVPALDQSADSEVEAGLAREEGIPAEEYQRLRIARVVYPTKIGGEAVAVWPAVDPTNTSLPGFAAQRLSDNCVTFHGLSSEAAIVIGHLGSASSIGIADTPGAAMQAWRSGASGFAVIVPLSTQLPEAFMKWIIGRQAVVIPCFSAGDETLRREAQLGQWARTHGVKMGSLNVPRITGPQVDI